MKKYSMFFIFSVIFFGLYGFIEIAESTQAKNEGYYTKRFEEILRENEAKKNQQTDKELKELERRAREEAENKRRLEDERKSDGRRAEMTLTGKKFDELNRELERKNENKNKSKQQDFIGVVTEYDSVQVGDKEILLNIDGRGFNISTVISDDSKGYIELEFPLIDISKAKTPQRIYDVEWQFAEIVVYQRETTAVMTIKASEPIKLNWLRGEGDGTTRIIASIIKKSQEAKKIVNEALVNPIDIEPEGPSVTFPFSLTGNEKIASITIRGLPLSEVLMMIGEALEKNIILDTTLPNGNVSISATNMDMKTFLTFLQTTYDLGFQLVDENTILIGNKKAMRVRAVENGFGMITKRFPISYKEPSAIVTLLTQMMKYEAEQVIVDDTSRAIFVKDEPKNFPKVAQVLQAIDTPGDQIMLVSRIIEFQDEDSENVETAINLIYDRWWMSFKDGGFTGGYIEDWWSTPDGRLAPAKSNVPIPGIIDGNWRLIDTSFAASALKGKGETLASPTVITLDGEPANIALTQEYPYPVTKNTGGTVTTEINKETAGPTLNMTPTIGRDGLITIVLNLSASEFAGTTVDGLPLKSSRSVTTKVRVHSGEPFVVGGLNRKTETKSRVKIPILGDIPILGQLFRRNATQKSNTQVVMLVVPYILPGYDTPVKGIQKF